jgi:purine-binding chemotaxis protein CheW
MELTEQFESNSYLSFKIGTELFGASVKHVISILEITKITRVPKAPPYMKGVINLRGSVLPVIDTRIKFGLDNTEYTNDTCILVLELTIKNESLRLGAIVDSVQEVLEIDESEIQPPPSLGTDYQSEMISGMTKRNDDFIMLLDIVRLFTEESMVELNEVSLDE